jgi:ribonuclease HII
MHEWLIGVDEAGRGPLAGPVAVGAALVPRGFDWTLVPEVGDSKALNEAARLRVYATALRLRREGWLDFVVAHSSAAVIDARGIVAAVNAAMERALRTLERRHATSKHYRDVVNVSPRTDLGEVESSENLWEQSVVKLDGGLRAPKRYMRQETIIKGDATEPAIGLASIVAKVTRDRCMERLAQQPALAVYDLATHKGYGTKAHREAIARHGLSKAHRASFCRNIESVV